MTERNKMRTGMNHWIQNEKINKKNGSKKYRILEFSSELMDSVPVQSQIVQFSSYCCY